MSAIAHNLKKMLKWKERKIEIAVMAMKKFEKTLHFIFLRYHNPDDAKLHYTIEFIEMKN